MQATLPHRRSKTRPLKSAPTTASPPKKNAAEEIHAFLAVRDILLAEAEDEPNEVNIHRLWMANDFAERCLEPARPPYEAQALANGESVRERQRCKAIKMRIAELRRRGVHRQAA